MDKNEQFWNEVYASGDYLKKWDYSQASPELVSLLAFAALKLKSAVVDLGCGTGQDAIFMAQCGHKASGIDISQQALDLAQKKAEELDTEVNWQQANFLDLPFKDSSIDFINDRGSLHLLEEAHWPELIKELKRILKPGGILFMRGASPKELRKGYTVITTELITRYFDEDSFTHGPVLPITLISDQGSLDANLVLISRL